MCKYCTNHSARHISNILKEGELLKDATVAKNATVVNRGIRGMETLLLLTLSSSRSCRALRSKS